MSSPLGRQFQRGDFDVDYAQTPLKFEALRLMQRDVGNPLLS